MPKLLSARVPENTEVERKICKLAGSRHASGNCIFRARIISLSWRGLRTAKIAEELGCLQAQDETKAAYRTLDTLAETARDGRGGRAQPGAVHPIA
jgi:hypothetical protein